MERAQASLKDALLRIEIGTLAPIDADATRQAVAQIEALIKADAVRTAQPAKTGPEIAALRIKLAETLNALDLAEVKFNNGMITTKRMNRRLPGGRETAAGLVLRFVGFVGFVGSFVRFVGSSGRRVRQVLGCSGLARRDSQSVTSRLTTMAVSQGSVFRSPRTV
jgi:hypothetical protein